MVKAYLIQHASGSWYLHVVDGEISQALAESLRLGGWRSLNPKRYTRPGSGSYPTPPELPPGFEIVPAPTPVHVPEPATASQEPIKTATELLAAFKSLPLTEQESFMTLLLADIEGSQEPEPEPYREPVKAPVRRTAKR